jgi:hypothetical protein
MNWRQSDRLLGMRTLLVNGSRDLPDGSSFAFTYRILFPDCFQEISVATFTIRGAEFWQAPPAGAGAVALLTAAKKRLFAEQSLVLLLGAPAVMPVRAELVTAEWDDGPRTGIRFTGPEGFDLTLVVGAADGAPLSYALAGQYGAPTGEVSRVTRRVRFTAFADVAGLRFPVQMEDRIADTRATIHVSQIRVNTGVRAEDFERRP